MRFSVFFRSALALAAIAAIPFASLAQTFAATTGTEAVINLPRTSDAIRVTAPAHHKHSDDLLYGRVRDGVFTVDGMVAKVHLNYDVNGVRYLYFFVPGVGTAVISAAQEPNTVLAQVTLADNDLRFSIAEHRFALSGVAVATSKSNHPEHLYVHLDRSAWSLNRRPMIGFGDLAAMPYQWPGALPGAAQPPAEASELAPPVPASLLPSTTAVVPRRNDIPAETSGQPSTLP